MSSGTQTRNTHGANVDHDAAFVAAQIWLALGATSLLCFPELRGSSPWIGWLPFWLVVAPLLDLIVLRRQDLGVASRRWLRSVRRRRAAPSQAQRRQRSRKRAPSALPLPAQARPSAGAFF